MERELVTLQQDQLSNDENFTCYGKQIEMMMTYQIEQQRQIQALTAHKIEQQREIQALTTRQTEQQRQIQLLQWGVYQLRQLPTVLDQTCQFFRQQWDQVQDQKHPGQA